MKESRGHILVAGAGLAGLIATIALQRFGFRVTVLEQSPELGEVGAGLTVGPNASRVLEHLGVEDRISESRVVPQSAATFHYATGDRMYISERGQFMREKYGADYYFVHRADLHAEMCAMITESDPNALNVDHRVTALEQDEESVTVTVANGESITGDALIGCDGIRSCVRGLLFETEPPDFMGYVAWRGLVPRSNLNGHSVEPAAALSLGPERSFLRYLVRNRELINYVAISKVKDWVAEGWSEPSTVAELSAHYAGWNDDVRHVIDATPDDQCFKWGLFARKPLDRWTVGRVTLVGDAAHPMLPFLGQGAAMAIEDGMVVARAIDAYAPLTVALEKYEAARLERTTWIQEQSEIRGPAILSRKPEDYGKTGVVNEDSLGVFAYDAVNVTI